MSNIHKVIQLCPQPVSGCYVDKIIQLDHLLASGVPFVSMGGKRVRQAPNLVRFKIGRKFRLIYSVKNHRLVPFCLVHRQQFDKVLKRR